MTALCSKKTWCGQKNERDTYYCSCDGQTSQTEIFGPNAKLSIRLVALTYYFYKNTEYSYIIKDVRVEGNWRCLHLALLD